ncbi:MAG: DUF4390 domain-containing protein [Nitrospinales bacterium]
MNSPATAHADAADPAIVNISVDSDGRFVLMDAHMINGLTDKIQEAIQSGVPITFTYTIELRKSVPLLADSLVSSNTVRNTIQYDSLKKVYRFSAKGKNYKRTVNTHDQKLSKKLMMSLKKVPVAPTHKLDPEEKYYLRVKADLETDRFWFPFNYIFFFVPFKDVKTAWAKSTPLAWDPEGEFSMGPVSKNPSKNRSGKPTVMKNVIRSFNK